MLEESYTHSRPYAFKYLNNKRVGSGLFRRILKPRKQNLYGRERTTLYPTLYYTIQNITHVLLQPAGLRLAVHSRLCRQHFFRQFSTNQVWAKFPQKAIKCFKTAPPCKYSPRCIVWWEACSCENKCSRNVWIGAAKKLPRTEVKKNQKHLSMECRPGCNCAGRKKIKPGKTMKHYTLLVIGGRRRVLALLQSTFT